eukprot:6202055-Pleurochrysis_carterae.AAC.2
MDKPPERGDKCESGVARGMVGGGVYNAEAGEDSDAEMDIERQEGRTQERRREICTRDQEWRNSRRPSERKKNEACYERRTQTILLDVSEAEWQWRLPETRGGRNHSSRVEWGMRSVRKK